MPVTWLTLAVGCVKLNSDATICSRKALGDGVLCNATEELIFIYYKQFGELSVLMAQGKSLLYDLKLCTQLGYLEMEVEVDSWPLVHLIKMLAPSVWPFRNL